jgi:hypothetical protein
MEESFSLINRKIAESLKHVEESIFTYSSSPSGDWPSNAILHTSQHDWGLYEQEYMKAGNLAAASES